MRNSFTNRMPFWLSLFLGIVIFMACNKKQDTIGIVKVVDGSGDPVGGVIVRVYGTSSTNSSDSIRLDMESTADATGKASFNFNDLYQEGQAGFAVLDIDVILDSTIVEKAGLIKVEEETTTEKTVEI